MKSMLKSVSVAAGVTLVALALAGVAAAQEIKIPTSDLDLNTPQGAARFDQRVNAAAQQLCSNQYQLGLGVYSECMRAVREEANDNLAVQQEHLSRQGNANFAGGLNVASAQHKR